MKQSLKEQKARETFQSVIFGQLRTVRGYRRDKARKIAERAAASVPRALIYPALAEHGYNWYSGQWNPYKRALI